jgi:hypothetical protein
MARQLPGHRFRILATLGASRLSWLDSSTCYVNEMRCVSAASVDSQFPVDPRYAGPLAGWLAPLIAVEFLNPLPPLLRLE